MIRRLDTSKENRVELARRVARGRETQRTLRELRDDNLDIDDYLAGEASDSMSRGPSPDPYDNRTATEVDTATNTPTPADTDDDVRSSNDGGSGGPPPDSEFCDELIGVIERYNDQKGTNYVSSHPDRCSFLSCQHRRPQMLLYVEERIDSIETLSTKIRRIIVDTTINPVFQSTV